MCNIWFKCDDCGREVNGVTYINGMRFCAKCYQQNFAQDHYNTLTRRINELEYEVIKADLLIKQLTNGEKGLEHNISNLDVIKSVKENMINKFFIKLNFGNNEKLPKQISFAKLLKLSKEFLEEE